MLWYVEVLLLAMSLERYQPLVPCSWDEITFDYIVLFNTRVQSCHEKFGHVHVRNVHVGGMHYAYIMFIISEDLNLVRI